MTAADLSSVDTLLVETVERLLADVCTRDVVEAAEVEGWCAPAWDALAGAGFPWISVPEESGGSGGSFADAMAVLRSVGRHACPAPVAETGVLAGWLLAAGGLPVPAEPITVVPDGGALALVGGRVQGEAVAAWAGRSTRIVGLVRMPDAVLIVSARPDQLTIKPGANMAGEPRDRVRFDVPLAELEQASAPPNIDASALQRRGALTRVVMAAGALEAVSQRTIDYAHARRQFGRPIAGFQAVQHHLVTASQGAICASMAADLAVRALGESLERAGSRTGPQDGGTPGAGFAVAAAKVIIDHATVEATRAAHQAHGAMGVTREYPLHQLSRRLWAWRHEYGRAGNWRRALGHEVAAAGPDELFRLVAG